MTHVLLDSDAEKVWRQNRALLVAASHPNNKCRCGAGKRIEHREKTAVSLCLQRRMWNFWKHDPPRIILHF